MTQMVQVLHAHPCPTEIVHGDIALRGIPQVLPDKHSGHAAQERFQGMVALGIRRQQDHPIHLAADHELKEHAFLFKTSQGVAQDNVVSPVPGLAVNVIGQFRHEGIGDVRDNQSQELGAFHHHGAGHGVGGVIHFPA